MEISAVHKNARIAPRKVRPLARLLRGMPVAEAQLQLQYLPGRIIRDVVLAVLKSAVANAKHNHGLVPADLTVAGITVDAGLSFRRFRAASKGMAHPFRKRTSHITVTVTGEENLPAGQAGKKEKRKKTGKEEIVTISADQYAAEALDNDQAEKHEEVSEHVHEKDTGVTEMPKSKEEQAFGKMRTLQGGGDKKKSFRRKSIG